MLGERDLSRSVTGLKRLVGRFEAPGIIDKLEALAHMDPVSVAIITGRANAKSFVNADRIAITAEAVAEQRLASH